MIVATPRPSSPSCSAQVPSYSISELALAVLPSLSLSRWMAKALRVPSGSQRGTTKQVSPASVCASVRKPSHIGAEQNHLCPVSRQPCPSRAARVVLARTSLPPCFSVIAMPIVAAPLAATGTIAGS